MQTPEKSEYRFTQFGGLQTNADARDIGPGAMTLENMTLIVPGQLTSRLGFEPVTWANDGATADADVLSLSRFETGAHKFIIYQLSHGGIAAGREPTL